MFYDKFYFFNKLVFFSSRYIIHFQSITYCYHNICRQTSHRKSAVFI